ncbi:DUF4097 family beta strand repeat-containing protein [Paraglaciecola sp.]|uniref:DUF4097 family beta strand repeat-containing protein n=1 Tax=Paraglaciecola sp. TaxID=1920173 RepID=UPI003EFA4C27
MKKLVILLSVLGFSLNASAEQAVNKSVKAEANGQVKIEHINGNAEVRGWDKNEVKVQGTLGDRTEKFIFERDGNEVIIKVKVKNSNGWKNWNSDKGDDLEIFVPKSSQVFYSSVNAELDIREIQGSSTIDTVNGDVTAKNLGGRIRIELVNGDVAADELAGNVRIETVNGDIRTNSQNGVKDRYESVNGDIDVTSESAEVKAETVNGDMELNLKAVQQLDIETVNGDAEVKLALLKGGEVDANSVGGEISLYFQKDVSATFDIETHAGGRISNDLSEHEMQKAKYGPRRWLEFSLNGGNASVNISTVSGRVELDRQ